MFMRQPSKVCQWVVQISNCTQTCNTIRCLSGRLQRFYVTSATIGSQLLASFRESGDGARPFWNSRWNGRNWTILKNRMQDDNRLIVISKRLINWSVNSYCIRSTRHSNTVFGMPTTRSYSRIHFKTINRHFGARLLLPMMPHKG